MVFQKLENIVQSLDCPMLVGSDPNAQLVIDIQKGVSISCKYLEENNICAKGKQECHITDLLVKLSGPKEIIIPPNLSGFTSCSFEKGIYRISVITEFEDRTNGIYNTGIKFNEKVMSVPSWRLTAESRGMGDTRFGQDSLGEFYCVKHLTGVEIRKILLQVTNPTQTTDKSLEFSFTINIEAVNFLNSMRLLLSNPALIDALVREEVGILYDHMTSNYKYETPNKKSFRVQEYGIGYYAESIHHTQESKMWAFKSFVEDVAKKVGFSCSIINQNKAIGSNWVYTDYRGVICPFGEKDLTWT